MTGAMLLCLAGALAAPPDFETFFQEFAEKRADIQVLEAQVEERTFEFGDVTLRRGRVVFGQPKRIIFRYDGDEPSMMVDGRRVYEYDPLEKQLQILDIEDSPESSIFFLGFDSDPGALRDAYDVRLFTSENERGRMGIVIRPFKENADEAPFQEVSIYLQDGDYLPYRIMIELDDDARMVTDFSNYTINQPMAPSDTQLRIPAETRVIENGEVSIHAVPPGGMLVPPAPLEVPRAEAGAAPEGGGAVSGDKPGSAIVVEELPAP